MNQRSGFVGLTLLLTAAPVTAALPDTDDTHSFRLMPYLWAAQYVGKAGDGDSEGDTNDDEVFTDLSLSGFMLYGEWRHRSRWKVFGDWTYARVTSDANVSIGRFLKIGGDVEVKGHVVQAAVGYEFHNSPTSYADVFTGARYLHINAEVEADTGRIAGAKVDGSSNWTDGIVGFKGGKALNDRWHLVGYGDIGAGGSDFTWQALGLVGYGFGWGNVAAGWRHLYVDYNSGGLKIDAYLTGPFFGAQFEF